MAQPYMTCATCYVAAYAVYALYDSMHRQVAPIDPRSIELTLLGYCNLNRYTTRSFSCPFASYTSTLSIVVSPGQPHHTEVHITQAHRLLRAPVAPVLNVAQTTYVPTPELNRFMTPF
jgi:hypothetical protein